MRKYYLYLRWKNIFYASLLLLLIVTTVATGVSASPSPYLHVEPPRAEIQNVDETVQVVVNCTDVVDYYGADFWLTYNKTILQPTSVVIDGPGQVAPTVPAQRDFSYSIASYNTTHDVIKFSCTFVLGEGAATFDGNGTVAWITFKGIAVGVSTLTFDLTWTKMFELVEVAPGVFIPGVMDTDPPVGGEIEVLPEFPAAIATIVILIATLAAVFLRKMSLSRKRKDALIAE